MIAKILAALSVLSVLMLFVSCGSEPSPTDLVLQYQQAVNNEDVEALREILADDCMYEVRGQWVKQGTEQLMELIVWDTIVNMRLSIDIDTVSGNAVYARVDQSND
ncbi:hypothetical protein GF377_02605, partial [candidate division GN15 bacterium]|nr:hypothetical protein [candidate division GN15 bacterium]